MYQSNAASSRYTQIVGVFLASEGVWGLSMPAVLGTTLTTNATHALIHIVLGCAGIWMGIHRKARGYCFFAGVILLGIGALSFLPQTKALCIQMLNINAADAKLNIVLGVLTVLMAFSANLRLETPL